MAQRAKIQQSYWQQPVPDKCQMCLTPLDGEFYEGKNKSDWHVLMCPRCNSVWGVGERKCYAMQADGRYLLCQ